MKRVLSLLLICIMLFSVCVSPVLASDTLHESDAPVADDVSVSAYAAIVVDMETGETLYDHDADEKNYPASCTKVMTAYLTLKYGDPDDMVTVTSDAFSNLSQQASTWDLKVGEEMTVYRALQCMLVVSACEAANVLGAYISGTKEEFVDLMNEEAQALGCTGTQFANCHGLPNSNHYTTARDLAIIAQAAMEYDVFREIVGSAINVLEPTNIHKEQRITSTNGLLPGSSYPSYNYEYAIGVKTGHSSTAGYNLVSAANKDGQELMVVVMGVGSREGSFSQSIKLYDWAYENYEYLTWGQDNAITEELVEEAPEYEETETSIVEEEEIIIVEEVGEPLDASEDPVSAADASVPAEESPEEAPETPQETSTAETVSSFSLDSISSSMLPVLLCFGIAFVLIIVLIIVLVLVLVRRRR